MGLVGLFAFMYVYSVIDVLASKRETDVGVSTTTPMLLVSKDVLLAAIRDAKITGGYLPIAVYEYNRKTDLWDRASLDCIKKQAQ